MQKIFATILSALQSAFQDVLHRITEFLPNLISAILILLMGWLVAKGIALITRRILLALHLDQAIDRRGVSGMFREMGISQSLSTLISQILYWTILLLFLLPALNTLQLSSISQVVGQFVSYLPNLFVGGLIFFVGLAIARFLAGSMTNAARKAELEYASAVGTIVQYFLTLIVIILALAQIGVQTSILTNIFIVLIVSLGLALALALGLGSRAVVANILAGAFAREHFPPGREVEVQGFRGRVVGIGSVSTTIETEDRQITLPNTLLVENIIN